MTDDRGMLEISAAVVGAAIAPLEAELAAENVRDFLAELGLVLPPDLLANGPFEAARAAAQAAARDVSQAAARISLETGGAAALLARGIEALAALAALVTRLAAFATALKNAASSLGVPPATVNAFTDDLAERLVDHMLVAWLTANATGLANVFAFTGVIDRKLIRPPAAETHRAPHFQQRMNLDRLPQLLTEPDVLLAERFGWGQGALDAQFLLEQLRDVLTFSRIPAVVEAGPPPRLVSPFLDVTILTGGGAPGLQAILKVPPAPGFSYTLRLDPTLTAQVRADLAAVQSLTAQLRPPFDLSLGAGGSALSGRLSSLLVAERPGGDPIVLLGSATGSRVSVQRVELEALLELAWVQASGTAQASPAARVALTDGRVVLDLADADGFIQKLAPPRIDSAFELQLAWSPDQGLEASGSAAIDIPIGLHLDLGPVHLSTLHIGLGLQDPGLRIGATVDGRIALGPVTATVERIGAGADIAFHRGNLGPVDVGMVFIPPRGIGMRVDAGVFKGGGFLAFDPPRGEYAGILELSMQDVIQLKAIGLLTTRMPDGSPGFSLLLIITGEFPPIQLGFGFTLAGVGGLIGINRTVDVEPLRAGLRQHSLDSVLFPPDPIGDAPQIISTLRSVFPPAEGRHVFGPMLAIGWGTPTLIRAEIGVLIEVPDPLKIVILGQIHAALPAADMPLVEINLDVLGVIDFGKKQIAVDASLYDSRVLAFSLSGDMALRIDWGDAPSFAVSCGGLHPHFPPPPGFPELRRLTLSIGAGNNPRLSCQSYWAITSNSFQFGARVELYASALGFTVRGWLGFDVLIIISPFSFEAGMEAGVELLRGSWVLMSISLSFTLSGPTPWRARGTASFTILFFEVSFDFDVSWGDTTPAILPAADPLAPLKAAFEDERNWSATLPTGTEHGVSLREFEPEKGTFVIHPLGRLTIRQRVLPLDMELERFGNAKPEKWTRFTIQDVKLNGESAAHTPVNDRFAPGQFLALTNEQKLSRPAFETMKAGMTTGSGAAAHGHLSSMELRYETHIVDDPKLPFRLAALYVMGQFAFKYAIDLGAASLSEVLTTGTAKYLKPQQQGAVRVNEPEHRIVDVEALVERADLAVAAGTGRTIVEQALQAHLARHPEDAGRLQVMTPGELAAA